LLYSYILNHFLLIPNSKYDQKSFENCKSLSNWFIFDMICLISIFWIISYWFQPQSISKNTSKKSKIQKARNFIFFLYFGSFPIYWFQLQKMMKTNKNNHWTVFLNIFCFIPIF
jgi:hypothetical protein